MIIKIFKWCFDKKDDLIFSFLWLPISGYLEGAILRTFVKMGNLNSQMPFFVKCKNIFEQHAHAALLMKFWTNFLLAAEAKNFKVEKVKGWDDLVNFSIFECVIFEMTFHFCSGELPPTKCIWRGFIEERDALPSGSCSWNRHENCQYCRVH